MSDLVGAGIATYKRHVVLRLQDGSLTEYVPPDWLAQPPFNVELRTLHIDRIRLHRELQKKAAECGVRTIPERAVAVERTGKKLDTIIAASGKQYAARWFIDASGSKSCFLARQLKLPYAEYGPRKVSMWSYASVEDWREGTTLYAENHKDEYLQWVWEIPVAPRQTSIGYVTTGASLKQQRAAGNTVQEIFEDHLGKFERFKPWLEDGKLESPTVTAFSCRVYSGVCGVNWVIAGEAAAVPDPITGNGVTSAMRHASEAAKLILKFNRRGRISWWARTTYNLRVSQMGKFFNSLIEKLAYDCPLRNRFGLSKTGDVYTTLAWSMNHLYSRIQPNGMLTTLLFSGSLAVLRGIIWLAEQIFRRLQPNMLPMVSEAY
jgi:flavin-dependent dehydrogenase